jgi:DNA-binding LytR/AlgR family response regulator
LKLIKKQQDGLTETEIELRYVELDETTQALIKHIEHFDRHISGMDNGRQYKIQIRDIYYVESVDKKTFIYTKNSVFRSELRLYQLHDTLKGFDFIQISKSCLVNSNVLESVRSISNSRLEAMLTNGEKVNVSRTYLAAIKETFARMEESE